MNDNTPLEMTKLLVQLGKPGQETTPEFLDAILRQMRRMAHRYMQSERQDHTLQATAVVHEAYMRLAEGGDMNWQSRGHFFGVASRLMRQVLVDYARSHNADRRGGGQGKLSLDDAFVYSKEKSNELVNLDEALSRLSVQDPRAAKVVELKFFAGLNFDEIAKALEVGERTAKRDWNLARAWLHGELSKAAKA